MSSGPEDHAGARLDPADQEAASAASVGPSGQPDSGYVFGGGGDGATADVPTVDVDSAPDDVAAPAPAASDAPDDALAQARKERDEYLDHLRRERAEFENFRRRSTKERMEALDRGAQQLATNLLHVLDTFALALQAADDRESDPLAKGVSMVHDELLTVLRNAGLEEVPGAGADFDPVHHEAVLSVDAENPADHPVVVEVLRPGYRFKGRVLRPASVKVAH